MSGTTEDFAQVVVSGVWGDPEADAFTPIRRASGFDTFITVWPGEQRQGLDRSVAAPARSIWQPDEEPFIPLRYRRRQLAEGFSTRARIIFVVPHHGVGWRAVEEELEEHFVLGRERIGRVRDIDHDRGVFTAVINDRGGDPDAEVVGRFPLSLLDHVDQGRIQIGTGFTLVTGQHALVSGTGELIKPALQTRILLHRPRPLSAEREYAARARGRDVRSRLLQDDL